MPEEYFKKTGKTQSGGGPHAMKSYGQGKSPYEYASPAKKGKTSFGDKLRSAWATVKTHADPDEKLGGMLDTYKYEKKKRREG